jgi:hypothetical protein
MADLHPAAQARKEATCNLARRLTDHFMPHPELISELEFTHYDMVIDKIETAAMELAEEIMSETDFETVARLLS